MAKKLKTTFLASKNLASNNNRYKQSEISANLFPILILNKKPHSFYGYILYFLLQVF